MLQTSTTALDVANYRYNQVGEITERSRLIGGLRGDRPLEECLRHNRRLGPADSVNGVDPANTSCSCSVVVVLTFTSAEALPAMMCASRISESAAKSALMSRTGGQAHGLPQRGVGPGSVLLKLRQQGTIKCDPKLSIRNVLA